MKKLTVLLLAVFMGITGCSSPGKGSDNKTPGPSASEASVNEGNQEPEGEYQIISPEETPAGLEEFLSDLSNGIRLYDCSDDPEEMIRQVLYTAANFLHGSPVHPKMEGDSWTMDEKDGDWILSNIFNFSPEAIQKIKQEHPVHGPDYTEPVFADGQYRWPAYAGDGAGYGVKNIDTAYNGKYYIVTYDYGFDNLNTMDLEVVARHYALLEYKVIDGKGWWSIYKVTENSAEIEGCAGLFPEEDEPADDQTAEDFTDWNYVAEQYYEIYLGYLEFINAKGDTSKLVNLIPEQEERFKYNYINYKVGHVYTNQVFDFDVSASRIVETSPGVYEADCYVFFSNRDELIETGEVTINNRTIHGTMRYDPSVSKWLLTGQEGFTYSYEGHMMIHCAK